MDNFHETANISDKITVIGNLEHVLYHARKAASSKVESEEEALFFQSIAKMALDFRRKYMKKHFPDCPEELWCLGKAVETARQRVYEADEGDTEDLRDIDDLWNVVWGRICKRDLSGCHACKEDMEGNTDSGERSIGEERKKNDRAKRRDDFISVLRGLFDGKK